MIDEQIETELLDDFVEVCDRVADMQRYLIGLYGEWYIAIARMMS